MHPRLLDSLTHWLETSNVKILTSSFKPWKPKAVQELFSEDMNPGWLQILYCIIVVVPNRV